jgi:hypothetical protein
MMHLKSILVASVMTKAQWTARVKCTRVRSVVPVKKDKLMKLLYNLFVIALFLTGMVYFIDLYCLTATGGCS